jgi:hypothetical protein
MKCGMCEAHINNLFRSKLDIKKIKSNHIKNQTIIFTNQELSFDSLKNVLDNSGYTIESIKKEVAKKTIFGYK